MRRSRPRFQDKIRLFVEGKPVPNPPPILKYFNLMDHMRWTHLPRAGGLYDQDPVLLDQLNYIFQERDKQREKEQKEREAETKRSSRGSGRVAGRRH